MSRTLYYQINSTCTNNYWDGERYGDWRRDNSFNSIDVYNDKVSGEIGTYTSSIESSLWENDHVGYAVIVRYSTGDTFGFEDGCFELVDVVHNFEQAQTLERAILSNDKDTDSKNWHEKTHFKVDDKEYYSGTWKGYFENLSDVMIERVDIVS